MKTFRDKPSSSESDITDISKPWDKDNQAWWDWYVGLADNNIKKDPIISVEPCQMLQFLVMMKLSPN